MSRDCCLNNSINNYKAGPSIILEYYIIYYINIIEGAAFLYPRSGGTGATFSCRIFVITTCAITRVLCTKVQMHMYWFSTVRSICSSVNPFTYRHCSFVKLTTDLKFRTEMTMFFDSSS